MKRQSGTHREPAEKVVNCPQTPDDGHLMVGVNNLIHSNLTLDLDAVRPISTFLRQEADRHGRGYVDLAAYCVGANGQLDPACSDDGLHLNASGYDIWVEKIRSEVYSSSDRGGDAVMHGIGGP